MQWSIRRAGRLFGVAGQFDHRCCGWPRLALVTISAAVLLFAAASLPAAELVKLEEHTWDEYAPRGKEVDSIYGDQVLRNDRLVAVIAQGIEGRNANMTVRNAGGALIDLTRLDVQSDQLSAYYPGGSQMAWRPAEAESGDGGPATSVSASFVSESAEGRPRGTLRYTLGDGKDWLLVETTYTNEADKPLPLPADQFRADNSFQKTANGDAPLFWVYDKWWGQAYGMVCEGHALACTSDARTSTVEFRPADGQPVSLMPGQSYSLVRRVIPGAHLLEVYSISGALAGIELRDISLEVRDTSGRAVAQADVIVKQADQEFASGRTDGRGLIRFKLPQGSFQAVVSAVGHGTQSLPLSDGKQRVHLVEPGWVVTSVTSEDGGPIPCKVQFRGQQGTADPDFGHISGEWGVKNLYYSHDGQFRQALAPGKYEAIVSHGPEHDAVFAEIVIERGRETPLLARLVHSVQTPGWVSSDFHSHSSPSGDNTSSQLGRVLNLLCEQIDFAPCTEHNRLSTYDPHLARLGVSHLLATCVGMELTESQGDINHQNAFPFVLVPRTQDNGAPLNDTNPEVQIERLAMWDGGSEKLVQQNHPDLGHLFFDRNGDGSPDEGYAKGIPFMDVIEVHPPHTIFQGATVTYGTQTRNNTIFNWLQLLNQGHRIPGVVNTDAHYNFHGSGFLRIYLASPSDDPARITTLDMVHAAEQGHVIMTSGPYLEVLLTSDRAGDQAGDQQSGTAGDDVRAPGGKARLKVRVQCPNWFDIDRVQVIVNGRLIESLNFTRENSPERFAGGVVKFDQEIPLALETDAHVIVAAAGERSTMGPVMGPSYGDDMPIAVSNPIFVDVDGGGFTHNGDTLDAPLPVMSGRRAP